MGNYYTPHTDEEIKVMLKTIGVSSVEELFKDIKPAFRPKSFKIPDGKSELEVLSHFKKLASSNCAAITKFLGAGFYDHYIPSVVDALSGRSEFYTAYTPYQPECSQGTLQAIYEYQSAICGLTGMDIANASLYEGGTALYEAAMMATRITGKNKIVVDGGVNPIYRKILYSYTKNLSIEFVELSVSHGQSTRKEMFKCIDDKTAGVILQNPNFFGAIDDHTDIIEKTHSAGALAIESVYPISLGILKTPREMDADIVTGEGQSMGIPLSFGGPYLGFMAVKTQFARKMPGRIAGATTDKEGKKGFVLTLQVREQHIRREKATSNICSNEALCAMRAIIYLSSLGKEGLRELAELNRDKAEFAKDVLDKIRGVEVKRSSSTFNEFTVLLPKNADKVVDAMIKHGFLAGLPLGKYYKGMEKYLLVAVTEKKDKRRNRGFCCSAKEGAMMLIFEKSVKGRKGIKLPDRDVPKSKKLDGKYLRKEKATLPEASELDIVRHFTRLSQKNFSIDTNFYPLGSCTMKYNPKFTEDIAKLPGFAELHPLMPQLGSASSLVQGALEVVYNVEKLLAEITGMAEIVTEPLAGAHGELAGIMLIAAYHKSRGNKKKYVIVPDSSHGTNPASAAIAGYELVSIPTAGDGCMDMEAYKAKLTDETAVVMLTCPNTLGVFNTHIKEVTELAHKVDAFVYYDGANLNAILGKCRPGDIGFDVVHLNLHKTFATPHGGGGPGAGPVGVGKKLVDFLPVPKVVKNKDGSFALCENKPKSIGRIAPFYGNFGVILKAYAYIMLLGKDGLIKVGEHSVLNANYCLTRLKDAFDLPYDRICMHEFVLSASKLKNGVRALDVAKFLIDNGIHPPTIYFPLVVKEAMMIEPTETESKETLDRFVEIMLEAAKLAEENPDILKNAPVTMPVSRLDEVKAARELNCSHI